MMPILATVFIVSLVVTANAAVLRSHNGNPSFFGDLAKATTLGLLQPQQQMTQQQMTQQQMMEQQKQMEAEQQAAILPAPPDVDVEKAEKLDTRQDVLAKEIAYHEEEAGKLLAKVEEMKKLGALENLQSPTAFEGTPTDLSILEAFNKTDKTPSITRNMEGYEAPIIIVQPPLLDLSKQLKVRQTLQQTLKKVGDTNSPAMKMLEEYELRKKGKISGSNLAETQSEIKKTKSEIQQLRSEREELLDKLKKEGRKIAKHGSNEMRAKVAFTNKDLEKKDKEIWVLADKLSNLKNKESSIIKREGPGKEAQEEEEAEEENEAEISGEKE